MLHLFKATKNTHDDVLTAMSAHGLYNDDDAIVNGDNESQHTIAYFSVHNGEVNGVEFVTKDKKDLDILNKVFSKFFA